MKHKNKLKKDVVKMEIKIPIGKQQKEMEQRLKIIIKLFPELTEDEQKRTVDYVIFTYNK